MYVPQCVPRHRQRHARVSGRHCSARAFAVAIAASPHAAPRRASLDAFSIDRAREARAHADAARAGGRGCAID